MTRSDAIRRILGTAGKFFSVRFTKRTTGEERTMNCRLGVTKDLRGGDGAYDPAARQLLVVWCRLKRAYRSIPLDALTHVSVDGEWVEVKENS